jgi:hypothetical protein
LIVTRIQFRSEQVGTIKKLLTDVSTYFSDELEGENETARSQKNIATNDDGKKAAEFPSKGMKYRVTDCNGRQDFIITKGKRLKGEFKCTECDLSTSYSNLEYCWDV